MKGDLGLKLLLSGSPIEDFEPEAYHSYVRSLYYKRAPKKATKKRLRDYVVKAKILKKGKVSVTTNRNPKYITEEEFEGIQKELGRGANEVFIALKEREISILSHEEAERIKSEIEAIPF